MTAFKDWNEAYANGHPPREAADYIWADAQTTSAFSNSSGFSSGEDPLPLTRSMPSTGAFPVAALGPVMAAAAERIPGKNASSDGYLC